MISIVVPAHNEAKLIAECLRSLRTQNFKGEFEIIVVDNLSTDATAKIAADMDVKVVTCQQKGVAYARQAGLEAALGEIVVQADADTIYPSWWLERIHKQFQRHPQAVAVAGTFIYKNPPWWANLEYLLRSFFALLSFGVFGHPMIISGANFAFRKALFSRIGAYDPHSYSSDQINISSRLSKVGKVFYDSRSYCLTSERSVAKPVLRILAAFIHNLSIFALHTIKVFRARYKSTGTHLKPAYLALVIPLVAILILSYGYFVPSSAVFGKVYAKGPASGKLIALTFDDGPNDPYTSQILDELEKADVRATFFAIGGNVVLAPDTVRRMLHDGNVIGNHTYVHNANHALYPNAYKDINMAEIAIKQATGVAPHLYRPPHGKKSPWELANLKKLGLVEIMWDISTNELDGRSPQAMANDIVSKAKPGAIIDIHDGYGLDHNTARSDKSKTAQMVPIIIKNLQAQGYTFVTIPELLNLPAYNNSN